MSGRAGMCEQPDENGQHHQDIVDLEYSEVILLHLFSGIVPVDIKLLHQPFIERLVCRPELKRGLKGWIDHHIVGGQVTKQTEHNGDGEGYNLRADEVSHKGFPWAAPLGDRSQRQGFKTHILSYILLKIYMRKDANPN